MPENQGASEGENGVSGLEEVRSYETASGRSGNQL